MMALPENMQLMTGNNCYKKGCMTNNLFVIYVTVINHDGKLFILNL